MRVRRPVGIGRVRRPGSVLNAHRGGRAMGQCLTVARRAAPGTMPMCVPLKAPLPGIPREPYCGPVVAAARSAAGMGCPPPATTVGRPAAPTAIATTVRRPAATATTAASMTRESAAAAVAATATPAVAGAA